MNILYGIAFLILIYYLIQWKNITNNLKSKLIEQHSIINSFLSRALKEEQNTAKTYALVVPKYHTAQVAINEKIRNHISNQINNDTGLIEGFNITTTTNKKNIFTNLEIGSSDKRNNCNSMFLPSAYSGIYNNEIKEGLYNYSMMNKKINLE